MGKRPMKSSGAKVPSSDAAQMRRQRHLWMSVAAMLVVGGTVGATLGANSEAQDAANEARATFEKSSSEVVTTLQLAIQHQDDLVVNANGFIAASPDATGADFRAWAAAVHMLDRYPEVLGFGFAVIVPASELSAFVARVSADPAVGEGSFQLTPPGDRPFYCLAKLGVSRITQLAQAGTDFCAGTGLVASVLARDTGQSLYTPVSIFIGQLLSVSVPVYRDGVTPATVEARREAFLGWVGTVSLPQVLLESALQGHPGMSASMRYDLDSSQAEFSSGVVPNDAQSVTTDLHNGWTIRTFGALAQSGMFADQNAFLLLLAGVALSVLLGILVFVLGTGRARAVRLVAERTGELRHQALHDALTGLPNRALIMDRIEQLLARNRRYMTTGAALFIDLDDFKNVNDTLGHEAGDRLLMAVATRLTSSLRDADTIGRMGGDEFVVLIDGAQLSGAPELVAERLLDVMRRPFELDGATMPLMVNASIGIAIGDRETGGDLLRDADVALYQAKEAGKNRYEVFHPEMQTGIVRRLELEFDLRSAIECHQFRLAYQPIYNLDDLTIVGVEALLRWDHPVLGVIEPDEFIPILEQSGQIQEVGRWVLIRACAQMATWHARGDTLDISVNVSARQLDHDAIVDHIREALELSGLAATSLIIEVTETALMRNTAATAQRLRAIKDLGARIAVDDFGTGYSSLSYLQQFPVDCLKIDRAFTNAITTSPESKALVGTLVQLGKDLGLKTLAEGVETTGEMDHLRGEHVNEVQGFLLCRPLDPKTLEARLLAPTRHAPPIEAEVGL